MKKIALLSATLVCAAFAAGSAPSTAAASYGVSGYPCLVGFYPPGGYYGSYGGVHVMLYSQPFCQGSYVGYGQALSTNGNGSCSGEQLGATLHPEALLAAFYQNAVNAAQTGQRLELTNTSCGQVLYAYFHGR